MVRKSAFKHWKICPKLYEGVWQIKDTQNADIVEGQYGTMMHSGGEQFFKQVPQQEVLNAKTIKETLKVFEPFQINHPVVHTWFENFKYFEAKRWTELLSKFKDPNEAMRFWLPVAVELEIINKQVGMEMHVDRIDRYEEHVLMNVEYKTNGYWNISDLRLECAFYNLGINTSGMFADPCLYYGVLNTHVNRSVIERITDRLLRRLIRDLRECKISIRDKNYPYKQSNFCRMCRRLPRCLEENFGES